MNTLSFLLSLQEITKGKKYIRPGQSPPKGVPLHTGKRGGRYYLTEDKHMKLQGRHHELVRSVGVKRDQWDELRDQFQKQGAKSVEFIPKPDYGKRDGDDTPLYNMYVDWGEATQKKIEEKLLRDKEKYGKRRESLAKIQEQIDALRKKGEERKKEASQYWQEKHPDPDEYLEPDEMKRLEELEGKVPKEEETKPVLEEPKEEEKPPKEPEPETSQTEEEEEYPDDGYEDDEDEPEPVMHPDGWIEYPDGRWEIPCTNRDGETEGTFSVEPVGKYSAGIFFTNQNGEKTRLTVKKERQLRREENIRRAKSDLTTYAQNGIKGYLGYLESQKPSDRQTLNEMLGIQPAERTDAIPWHNDHNLSFENADEAKAWASNNVKTVITGLEDNANMGHLASILSWTKSFENAYGMAIPGRVHMGVHANWGNRAYGIYYYASNSMHFRQDMDIPWDRVTREETERYLAEKEAKGDMSGVPWSASDDINAVYWHEFGHLLDHLTGNGLSQVVYSLSAEEKKQIRSLSDYPASKKNPRSMHAEYVAESVSALMTGSPRAEHIPDPVKQAIEQAFQDMPNLSIDFNVPDPVNVKDWTDAEGEFYNKVRLPEHPKDLTDENLQEYYAGMSPDDIFSVLKNAKAALQDKKLNPGERVKETTRQERYAIRQNLERVIAVTEGLHKNRVATDHAWNDITGKHTHEWTKNADGYEQTPYYQWEDPRGRPGYYTVKPEDRVYKRNGFLELRPAGAIGIALYHVDDDGTETLLVDHTANPRRGRIVTDREAAREEYADNLKRQIHLAESSRNYKDWSDEYKRREAKKKERAAKARVTKETTTTEPGQKPAMHKDTMRFLSYALNTGISSRPSDMTPEDKEKYIRYSMEGYVRIGAAKDMLTAELVKLGLALATPAETRSEKNLQKKYKDQLDEGKVALELINERDKRLIERMKERYQTDNPVLATYMNNTWKSAWKAQVKPTDITIPSRLSPEHLKASVEDKTTMRDYLNLKAGLDTLTGKLEEATDPKDQRNLSETIKEHKIIFQAARENIANSIIEHRASDAKPLTPPKIVADALKSDQYPQKMTPDEYDAWTSMLNNLTDDELIAMSDQINMINTAWHFDEDWRKEQKLSKLDYENNHRYHLGHINEIHRRVSKIRYGNTETQ